MTYSLLRWGLPGRRGPSFQMLATSSLEVVFSGTDVLHVSTDLRVLWAK